MKTIEDNTLAAFYLKRRRNAPKLPARDAWHFAKNDAANHWKAKAATITAQSDLESMWESLGKIEPKRFSKEGESLHTAREKARTTRETLARLSAYRPADLSPRTPGGRCSGYSGDGNFYYLESDDGAGVFRDVKAAHDCPNGPGHEGWYTNPHGEAFKDGSGLCWGVVAVLPAKNGQTRYLPGYQFGGVDCGVSIALDQMTDCESDAARMADSLAQNAAESEKEFQAASGAGNRWAELAQEVKEVRAETLSLLCERRLAMKGLPFRLPNTCAAIRATVSRHIAAIQEARQEMEELAQGDSETYGFYAGDKNLREAFCDAAGLEAYPL